MSNVKNRVLFVCTGNRARSQMAEGLLRHAAGDRVEVHSAGIVPNGMSELTVGAMAEIGIDISEQWSKSVDVYRGQEFDFVITVCNSANETCPVFPGGGQRLHWDIEDPSDIEARGLPLKEAFRIARDDLQARIAKFVDGHYASPS